MARTNEAAVKLVIDTSLTTAQIDAFIDDASLIIDRMADLCDDATTAQLTAAEKYVAAGLISLRDPTLTSKRIDDVEERYQRDRSANQWFQAAEQFDPCGVLAGLLDPDAVEFKFKAGTGYA